MPVSVKELIYALDPVRWARERLEFDPDEVQRDVLGSHAHRLMLNCTRQWGKSTVTAAKALHHALHHERSTVLVASPSERQSGEFLQKACEFAEVLEIRVRGDGRNAVSLKLPNGSRIVGLPDSPKTTRGFSRVSLLILDEAAQVADVTYRSLLPSLAVSDGDLWVISTPFGQRGFFWELWTQGGAGWKRVSVTAAQCPRIRAGFLEEQQRLLGELWFRQEYCCEFLDLENSLFERSMLLALVRGDVQALGL
jgi:hypothetical protein